MKKGFTLLELLMVIAIMTVLIGLVIFSLRPSITLNKTNKSAERNNSLSLERALDLYKLDHRGSLPSAVNNLQDGYYDVCKPGAVDTSNCIVLNDLIPKYISKIPVVETTSNPNNSGYKLNYTKDKAKVKVYSENESKELGMPDAQSLAVGLVGYWKFNEASWVNNCSTASVIDSSGMNRHGKSCPNLSGISTLQTGKYGNAAVFDATDDHVIVADHPDLRPTNTVSVAAWVYPTTLALTDQKIVNKGQRHSNETYNLALYYNYWRFYVRNTSSELFELSSPTPITLNQWYHLAGTYDGTNVKIYVNGQLTGTRAGCCNQPLSQSTVDLSIGGLPGGGYNFPGKVDEVRIYNRALSAQEVSFLYSYVPSN